MISALAVAAIAIAAPADAAQFAGLYEINQMEMAGGLELSIDGRFRYAFDYGAVSEVSSGKWAVDGNDVLLTTDPMPPAAECDRGYASACFRATRLSRDDGDLILMRWDARIVLRRD
jgi:hypothetical protein